MVFCTGYVFGVSEENIPVGARIILNKAQKLYEAGKLEEAIKVLSAFQNKKNNVNIKISKKRGYSHYYIDYALGNYFLMNASPQQAIPHYQEATRKKKDFTDAWLNLAKSHYDLDQMKPAGDAFLKGYKTASPGNPQNLYYSAICYATAMNYSTAYDVFSNLLKNHSKTIKLEWKESLVQILHALNKTTEALPYIEELAKKSIGKKQKKWREICLSQYMSLKMEKKALNYVKWLTRVDTLEPKWWKALAHMNLHKDKYEDALVALLAYSFLTNLSPSETLLIADIQLTLGIPDQAVKFYEKLLKKSLKPEIIKKIIHAYMQQYDHDTAMHWIEKSLKNEIQPDLLMLKGNILLETGKYTEAKRAFQKASKYKKYKKEANKALQQLKTAHY